MSGRDLRNFIHSHKVGHAENLVKRVESGLASNKYKPVDYDKLRALATEKKFHGQESLVKVKKLQKVSKQGKEQNLLKQHRRVWLGELLRQNALKKKLDGDIEAYLKQEKDDIETELFYQDFEEYEIALAREFDNFKTYSVNPVLTLKEDLQYWIEIKDRNSFSESVGESPEKIRQVINSVKQQQKMTMDQLYKEEITLENDLKAGTLPQLHSHSQKSIQTGIPIDIFDLECLDYDLKVSVLQDFIYLDEVYVDRLHKLDQQHLSALSSDTGGWSDEDHFCFCLIAEQYASDMRNKRELYIDRLLRHFSDRTYFQLKEHDDWLSCYKYYHKRRADLLSDWTRDRKELSNRAKVTFMEISRAYMQQQVTDNNTKKQKAICDALYAKVAEWREMKLEAMRLEQQLEASRQQDYLEQQKVADRKERKKREKEKERIHQYQHDQDAIRKENAERERQRLEELKALLAEQASSDAERVQFREDKLKEKEEMRAHERKVDLIKEANKEQRLEALRQQVRPMVKSDLLRLWSETKTWQAKKMVEEEADINRPLFDVNTFTSKQVTADPRMRLEEKLREANLIHTDYARQALVKMKPLHAPRIGLESSLFK